MEKWEKHYNEQKGIYEIYPTKVCNPRVCAVMNQTEEESIANLIAAAPDLLEALLQLSRIASAINTAQHAGVEICPELWSDLYSLTNKAKQAIDKAGKGE